MYWCAMTCPVFGIWFRLLASIVNSIVLVVVPILKMAHQHPLPLHVELAKLLRVRVVVVARLHGKHFQ